MIEYATFILTHGRPDRQYTYETLKRLGYDRPLFFLIDDMDETGAEYKKRYGDKVITFDKRRWYDLTDTMDVSGKMNVVVFARNAVFEIAKSLGYRYIVVLDDDYMAFEHRYEANGKLKRIEPRKIGDLFEASLQFLIDSGITCYCWVQGGDFIGGLESNPWRKQVLRKMMNTYFFDCEKPVTFKGTLNEDMVASLYHGLLGDVVLSSCDMSVKQEQTQQNAGGLTEAYLDMGTYVKSFYAVMMNPSCCTVQEMGDPISGNTRMHHRLRHVNAYPMIMSDRYRKGNRAAERR